MQVLKPKVNSLRAEIVFDLPSRSNYKQQLLETTWSAWVREPEYSTYSTSFDLASYLLESVIFCTDFLAMIYGTLLKSTVPDVPGWQMAGLGILVGYSN